MHELLITSEIAVDFLSLFLDQESPLFYQRNACDFDNLKLIGHGMTAVCFRFTVYCM